jgi:carboxypeptidase PM20D1
LEGISLAWEGTANNASKVSSATSDSYKLIAAMAKFAAPEAAVTPSLVLGATDARHYGEVAENVYRFAPAVYDTPDLECIHGVNERLSVDNLERMARSYVRLLMAGAG